VDHALAADHVGRHAGGLPQVRSPMRFSGSPVRYDRSPPLIGEHTAEVLSEKLGYDEARITALGPAVSQREA
jgi:crotonobetainyl-CoA:carnitine CoA-transferase CaiB-like acyl-CoA transferase